MTSEQFRHLLKKYRRGSCSAEEQKLIEDWYASIEPKDLQALTPEEEGAVKKSYWQNVNAHIQSKKPFKKKTARLWPPLSIAASIVLVIATYFYFQPEVSNTAADITVVQRGPQMESIHNGELVPKNVLLPEGSTITLQPGSKISYPGTFNKAEREIYLEGEAFFEVKRDETRPFLVYTNEITTKVLGTSFTIKAHPGEKSITVAVKTGKVSVYTKQAKSKTPSRSNETILTPNQQVVYNRKENKVSRMLVPDPQAIMPAEEIKKWHFEEASVTEIFIALEKIYGVDIVFNEKLLSSCTLTTSISDGPIFKRLDIICKAIGTTYTVEETQIIINGSGCN